MPVAPSSGHELSLRETMYVYIPKNLHNIIIIISELPKICEYADYGTLDNGMLVECYLLWL